MANLYLYALLIGMVCGLRSMTAPAVVCWGARLGWLRLAGWPVAFLAHPVSLVIFTLFAIGEIIADKLPKIPRRTEPGPLVVRIVFGALCAAALAISSHAKVSIPAMLGAIGAVAGSYGGYNYRRMAAGKIPDFAAALLEDLIAVGGGFLIVSRF
jgi:uncharacterized membrane protein